MCRYERVREAGITFFFKYDSVDSAILHIYARHLTSIDDALDVYFITDATWNDEFHRFENFSETHGLFWFWRNEIKKEVIVITCFGI